MPTYRHNKELDSSVINISTNISINKIFSDHWESYKYEHCFDLREVEVIEVEKMLRCFDKKNGYVVYYCPECYEEKTIHFNCNSRICSRCGKLHADDWARKLKRRLFKVDHRHVVMTIPEELRQFFKKDRKLFKPLMDCAIESIRDTLSHYVTKRDHKKASITPGIVVVLHTYGRDLGLNPHIHVIMSEGGFNQKKEWVRTPYLPYTSLRKTWQYQVLTNLKKQIPDTIENRLLIDKLFKKHKDGFYVRAKDKIKNVEGLRYIGRYVRHPAIANSRIIDYDGENVTFWYERDEKRFYKTMSVYDFITAIIGHVPDKQFKIIRYYGAYSRRKSRILDGVLNLISMAQSKLNDFTSKTSKRQVKCPNCGSNMKIVECVIPPPTKNWHPVIEITRWM